MVRVVEMRTVPTWGEGDYIIFFSGHAVSNCVARITNFFIECLMVQAAVVAAVASNVRLVKITPQVIYFQRPLAGEFGSLGRSLNTYFL